MLGKIKKIWADLPEYMLTSGYSVTTLEQRFNSPPRKASAPCAYVVHIAVHKRLGFFE
jgi:hypothetical protein